MQDLAYRRIVENIDLNPMTAPKAEGGASEAFLKFLQLLYSPAQAEIVQHLKMGVAAMRSAAGLAELAARDENEVEQLLEPLLRDGRVSALGGNYALPSIPALLNHHQFKPEVGPDDIEAARLYQQFFINEKYYRYYESSEEGTQFLRVVPVQRAVGSGQQILDSEEAHKIIDAVREIRLVPCPCRTRTEKLGIRECKTDTPVGFCITMESSAFYFQSIGVGRKVTAEEAKKYFDQMQDLGLVGATDNFEDAGHSVICLCCACCCSQIGGRTRWDNPDAVAPANFVAEASDDCLLCGNCEDRCPFGAIALDDDLGRAVTDAGKCVGCGVCTITCDQEALRLKRFERERPFAGPRELFKTIAVENRRGAARPAKPGHGWKAAAVALLLMAGAATSHAAALNTKLEVHCFDALAKAASKHQAAVAKARAKCRDGVISGKLDAGTNCLTDPDTVAAIDKSAASIAKSVTSKCKSTCSVSGVYCIDNLFCPPNGATPENCTAGAKGLPFSAGNMGFPGSYCEAVLGGELKDGAGFGGCMAELATTNADRVMELVYGSVDGATGLSKDAAKCVSAIAKALPKSAGKMAGAVSKCRSTQLGLDPALIAVDSCATLDAKTAESLAKEIAKLEDRLDKKCTDATMQELDLCEKGVGGVADLAAAKSCLDDILNEAAYSIENLENRDFVDISLINAAYPKTTSPRCGDNLVNQMPNQFLRTGEECDGEDAAACPGACFPPGDVFECSCPTTRRLQSYADGPTSDFDNGWTGAAHNGQTTQGAGFVTDIVDGSCNCSAFGGPGQEATCVGTTTDPICDLHGAMGPRCSYAPYDGITCDQHGNGNGIQSDTDCQVCDENSINAGAWCQSESDCQSQCFNAAGTPTGPCERQRDCAAGESCRGRCDKETVYCNLLREGGPQPVMAKGTAGCQVARYYDDVTGTRNIVTGEHAVNVNMRSNLYSGASSSRPCPVCGGFCTAPDSKIGEICQGTCSGAATECRGGPNKGVACVDDTECPASKCQGVACRFDQDCCPAPLVPCGETCGAESPECLGRDCQLALLCTGGSNDGRACRIEAWTEFGTTSVDCPPSQSTVIDGSGTALTYAPLTSERVELPNPGICDTPGFEKLNGCHCVTGGGTIRSKPNGCAPACTAAGADYGKACGGNFTTCFGGSDAGVPCDENADCSGGGTCTANPKVCHTGTNNGNACTGDGDCPGGTCIDACPGGICTPFCVEKGVCAGGANAGQDCGVDLACPGGTCVVTDAEEGVCAAGPPIYHCNGVGQEFRTCLPADEGTTSGCEAGVDDILGTDDDVFGANICVAGVRDCYVHNGAAEGGDTLNGQGDPTSVKSVATYCVAPSSSSAANATGGLPGPARLRMRARLVPNFTVLP